MVFLKYFPLYLHLYLKIAHLKLSCGIVRLFLWAPAHVFGLNNQIIPTPWVVKVCATCICLCYALQKWMHCLCTQIWVFYCCFNTLGVHCYWSQFGPFPLYTWKLHLGCLLENICLEKKPLCLRKYIYNTLRSPRPGEVFWCFIALALAIQ